MIARVLAMLVLGVGLSGLLGLLTSQVLIVRTGSMAPALQPGDAVVIGPASRPLAVGDIVTYQVQGRLITHRIAGVDGEAFITKGDANEAVDPWKVSPAEVRGSVLLRIPCAGYLLAFLRQPGGWFLFVLLPALAIIHGEAREVVTLLRQRGRAVPCPESQARVTTDER